jgi:DNA-binding protein HU-beta
MRESDMGVSWRLSRRGVVSACGTSLGMVNRQELIDRVAAQAELPRPAAARAVDSALAAIEDSLRSGEPVKLSGFGSFRVARYTGRAGVNPRTGERIAVATTPVPRFRAGSRLRAAVR